jgi:hypothetical protein
MELATLAKAVVALWEVIYKLLKKQTEKRTTKKKKKRSRRKALSISRTQLATFAKVGCGR